MSNKNTEENKLKHVFYFDRNNQFVEWNNYKSIEKEYWTAVLKDILLSFQVIVTENSEYLPKYGDDVVVILKSDEFVSEIKYADRVKAVFKNYFDEKYFSKKNIFFLPLPYLGNINDLSIVPILDRKIDVFFAGQVTYPERNKLSKIISELKDKRKDLNIVFQENQNFFTGWNTNEYFLRLGDSKISLCPKGASKETYRHFESLRHGCVSISLPLPDVWYFTEAPMLIIQKWDEFPSILDNLINNKKLLKKLSNKSRKYWNDKLSPKAVSSFIVSCIYSST